MEEKKKKKVNKELISTNFNLEKMIDQSFADKPKPQNFTEVLLLLQEIEIFLRGDNSSLNKGLVYQVEALVAENKQKGKLITELENRVRKLEKRIKSPKDLENYILHIIAERINTTIKAFLFKHWKKLIVGLFVIYPSFLSIMTKYVAHGDIMELIKGLGKLFAGA
jgi:hypothetical protein